MAQPRWGRGMQGTNRETATTVHTDSPCISTEAPHATQALLAGAAKCGCGQYRCASQQSGVDRRTYRHADTRSQQRTAASAAAETRGAGQHDEIDKVKRECVARSAYYMQQQQSTQQQGRATTRQATAKPATPTNKRKAIQQQQHKRQNLSGSRHHMHRVIDRVGGYSTVGGLLTAVQPQNQQARDHPAHVLHRMQLLQQPHWKPSKLTNPWSTISNRQATGLCNGCVGLQQVTGTQHD
jgi:hypothetical protein